MIEDKSFLKNFFKNTEKSIEKSVSIPWHDLSKKTEKHERNIRKSIEKLGDTSHSPPLLRNSKNIYNEYQEFWKKNKTIRGILKSRLFPPFRDKQIPLNRIKIKELFLILFSNPNEGVEKGLYDSPDQFDDFLENIIKNNKQSYLKQLISELLFHYPEDRKLLFERLNKIYENLDKNKNSNKFFFEATKKFHLIEESGPHIIAENILDLGKNLNDLLFELWIRERHLSNGIGENVMRELCKLMQEPLKQLSNNQSVQEKDTLVLKRFLEYLSGKSTDEQLSAQTPVRYRDIEPVVKALLNPFECILPEQSIRATISGFLDQHIKDPRFYPERWVSMPKEKDIFLSWKIGETIESFLELLSYTAKEDLDADRMWPYRKEFIKSYWKEGHITAAWIVLGREAYKNRLKFLKKKQENYGKITSRATNPLHSVLLFQIRGLVISEWNYNGKVRVWEMGNEYKPVLYEAQYQRKDLVKKPDKEIIHSSAESYYWQNKLSDYIEKYTGIPCPENLRKKID